MDTQCVSVIPQGSRRSNAVESAKNKHVIECENRIIARAKIANGADPRYKNGK